MTSRTMPVILLLPLVAAGATIPSPDFQPLKIGVLLRFEHDPGGRLVRQLEREVEHIFQPARLDLRFKVVDGKTSPGAFDRVVNVEMRGRCDPIYAHKPWDAPEKGVVLGHTLVSGGEVLPYAVIDCDEIARVAASLRPVLRNPFLLDALYLRISGQVLTHEMIHVLLRTTEHHASHFTHSPLLFSGIVAARRLDPSEAAALQRIGRDLRPSLAQRGPGK